MNELARLRKAAGLTQARLAELAGTTQVQIGRLETGQRQLSKDWSERLAPCLNVSPIELLFPNSKAEYPAALVRNPTVMDHQDTLGLPFGGIVQAGLFLAVDIHNQVSETRRVPLPRDPRYSRAKQCAYEVRGDSMNLAHIEDGMIVHAVDCVDFCSYYGELRDGMCVVVERLRFNGQERELTVKELRLYRDRMELVPRSTNSQHRPISLPYDADTTDDSTSLQIIAVVIWAGRDIMTK